MGTMRMTVVTLSSMAEKTAVMTAALGCVAPAVDMRETALLAALDTYSATVKAALTARKDALKAAWSLTDPKALKAGVEAAWKTYREAHKTAMKIKKDAVKSAWKTYEEARKACKAPGVREDKGADAQL